LDEVTAAVDATASDDYSASISQEFNASKVTLPGFAQKPDCAQGLADKDSVACRRWRQKKIKIDRIITIVEQHGTR